MGKRFKEARCARLRLFSLFLEKSRSEEVEILSRRTCFYIFFSLKRKFAPSLFELFSNLSTMAENGAPDAASATADVSYVLPEKWTEDTVDEKGEKMSKT